MADTKPDESLIEGRFRVVASVGAGSFGRVLQVVDVTAAASEPTVDVTAADSEPTAPTQLRAMKVVPPGPHEAMLLAEFEQLARLSHPALPRVFEVGRLTHAVRAYVGPTEPAASSNELGVGSPYFIAEWIAGTRLDSPGLTEGTDGGRDLGGLVWSMLADIAGALATMHAAGIVHADVAPQNILVTGERAVLVDLGLAGSAGAGAARGTPAYMAPEAFVGGAEPRSDLYGLGASIVRLVTGRALVEAATLGELVQRIVAGVAPRELPGLPAPLADLVQRLVVRDPDRRPASAAAVLEELDQIAPLVEGKRAVARGGTARGIGPAPAAASWPGAEDRIAQLMAVDFAVVAGPRAAGAAALVEVAMQRRQLAAVAGGAAPRAAMIGTIDRVADVLGVRGAAPGLAGGQSYIERIARAVRGADAPVTVDAHGDPRAKDLVLALGRAASRGQPVIVLADAAVPGAPTIAAPVFALAETEALAASMLGATPKRAWTEALHDASAGLPGAVIEIVRSLAGESEPLAVDLRARSVAGLAELRAQSLRALSAGARAAAVTLAAWGGTAERADLSGGAVELQDLVELERAGLARASGTRLVADRPLLDAIGELVGADAIAAAATAIEARVALTVRTPDDVAGLYEHARLVGDAAVRAVGVAEQLLARGRSDRALAIAKRVDTGAAGLVAARAALATGAYREAMDLARAAEQRGAGGVDAALVVARAAQRAGDLDLAEATLATLHRAQPAHAEAAGAYARLLVTRSRFAEARAVATAGGPLAGLRAEAAGLAAFYLGDLDAADAAFAALEVGADASGDAIAGGRAKSLRGMVAQQRGRLALASDHYRDAAARFAELGEVHAAAVAELNLGTVLAERGRASDALPRLVAAGRVFGELGATTELIAADLNRGNALVALGQATEAHAAARAAAERAQGAPHLKAFALLVAGDALRRLGDQAAAVASYRDALAIGTERRDTHAQLSAHVALAEAGIAPPAGVDVGAACASDDDRDRWTLARARLALANRASTAAGGPTDGKTLGDLAAACADVARRAEEADRLERATRAHALAARCAAAANDRARAATAAQRARAVHATLLAATAPAFRAAVSADPDLVALAEAVPEATRAEPTRADSTAAIHLRRLLTLSRRLNTEASVERILDEVIDTAIELTAAERGFLLLRQDGGELTPVVARNFDAAAGSPSVSRSIAERAAQTGEPVMTVDAGVDERFGAAASVAALRLRSVLAVPLRQRGTVIGCIYVDHRLRGGAFDEAAASLLGELADIAAIAIENARLTAHLARTAADVDALASQLSAELAERDAELVRVKADLPDRDRLRHRYDRIVGRSPAMLRMLEVVDRATATTLPVVIVGESGTGKELVARALHDQGPRKDRPFVAINCSAVPEQLLESELFGHVRGAFTGAERDRRGLFEVADGGTLFLDEIADTSPAMQAKLLRVLQDGQLRRVGDTKTQTVDVRVIAATQRPLADLVAAGRFREDLRFRLEVIAIAIPPLRERDGDLPLLVEALLARGIAGTSPAKPPRVTRHALRALAQHRWPGNIRELENALARGVAMGGDVIDIADLPEAIASAAAKPEPVRPALGDDLRLKPALQATEKAYIGAAMERAKNNQTVAARLLGLSRFGLQKKLRRLAGEDPAADDDD